MKNKKHPELVALKGKIREQKQSYRTLGKEIGMSVDALNNKINGYSIFNLDEVNKIVEALHIDPSEILKIFFPEMLRNATKNKQ
ncbi:helix-turn-helix domain-containing protein [Defluviitalea raffinosedens]|nr:helix-turn-helix transcriptional regulator [Defluviitalea raffinosedens]